MSTDAIVMLKNDHKDILRAFRDFEKAGDRAVKAKSQIVDNIIELLTVHTYVENEVMYPRVRELVRNWRTTYSSPTRSTTSLTCWSWNWPAWTPRTSGSRPRRPC